MADELAQIPGIILDPSTVETNIVRFKLDQSKLKKKIDHNGVVASLRESH